MQKKKKKTLSHTHTHAQQNTRGEDVLFTQRPQVHNNWLLMVARLSVSMESGVWLLWEEEGRREKPQSLNGIMGAFRETAHAGMPFQCMHVWSDNQTNRIEEQIDTMDNNWPPYHRYHHIITIAINRILIMIIVSNGLQLSLFDQNRYRLTHQQQHRKTSPLRPSLPFATLLTTTLPTTNDIVIPPHHVLTMLAVWPPWTTSCTTLPSN